MSVYEASIVFAIVCAGSYVALWIWEKVDQARDTLNAARQLLDDIAAIERGERW